MVYTFPLLFWQVDFGEVFIPVGLDVPKPRVLPEFKRLAHGLRSSNISVLDAKTFYIPNLHYDGAGPDAYFWVGNGSEPNIMGIKVLKSVKWGKKIIWKKTISIKIPKFLKTL